MTGPLVQLTGGAERRQAPPSGEARPRIAEAAPPAVVLLRRARLADVPVLYELLDAYARQGLLLPRTAEQIAHRIREFTVAVDAHGVAGCGALRLYTPELGEVVALAVADRLQGQGIGRSIVESIVDEAQERGVRRLFALTLRERFFNQLGFVTRPMAEMPEKLAADCASCPRRQACNEILVLRELPLAHCN